MTYYRIPPVGFWANRDWGSAFSPDGTRLVTAGRDGTARVYLLDVDELVRLAENRLTRWFTPDECRQYLHVEQCPPRP